MKTERSICVTSRLGREQKQEIEALGRACRAWEPVTQEPFTDSEENIDPTWPCFYIYYENTYPVSFLGVFMPDKSTAEISGFTLPGYRRKGHFKELLECAQKELADKNLDFYVVSDGKSKEAQEMLAHMGKTAAYSETMMAAPLSHLQKMSFVPGTGIRAAEEEFQVEENKEECLLTCGGQVLGRCRLAYFPGTVYLYGFTIDKSVRRQGLGRLFLKRLACAQREEIHTMLLQVGSRNEAACGLYRACGFQVTEQLDYYPV